MPYWKVTIPVVFMTLMLFVSVKATESPWIVDTQENWNALTGIQQSNIDLNFPDGKLVLEAGKDTGYFGFVKDFGNDEDWTSIRTDTTLISANGESATLDIWVSDDSDFTYTQHRTFDLINGDNDPSNLIDISDLPAKRFANISITLNRGTGNPAIDLVEVRFIHDSTAPTTTAEPASIDGRENVSFTLACSDGTGGSGCNKTYYQLTTVDGCGPRLVGKWSFESAETNLVQEPFYDIDAALGPQGNEPQITNNGKKGKALLFDGISGFAKIEDKPTSGRENNPLLNNEFQFGVEMWIYPTSFTDNSEGTPTDPVIISKWWGDASTEGDYQIGLNQSGYVIFTVADNEAYGTKKYTLNSINPIEENQWYHIAATFDTGDMWLFINGEDAGSKNSLTKTQAGAYQNDDIYIGATWADEHNFDGVIDEVMLYDGVLTADDVADHYLGRGLWSIGTSGEAGCNEGEKCDWHLCAYSKDNSNNIGGIESLKDYNINKQDISCNISVDEKVGKNFTVAVETNSIGISAIDLIWGSDSSMDSSSYIECTAPATFSGDYECWGLQNASSLYLACSATSTTDVVSNSSATEVASDIFAPTCIVTTEDLDTKINVSCICSDPGSGIKTMSCGVNQSGTYLLLSTQGCTVPAMDCANASCTIEASCGSDMEGKDFVAKATDNVDNARAWTEGSCTDADGDGYCAGDDCDDDDEEIHPGAEEVCDGKDNDCSGEEDDKWLLSPWNLTQECSNGLCDGVMVCNKTMDGTECSASEPQLEICDNDIDDDCDGTVDEPEDSEGNPCVCQDGDTEVCGRTTGPCEQGIKTCVDGEWGSCVGAVDPVQEICDDLIDNDCDGVVDEDGASDPDNKCVCKHGDKKACGSNNGECRSGYQTCSNGVWGDCIGGVRPTQEICDGKDNDCDLVTDNDCIDPDTCSNGEKDEGEDGVDCGGVCDDECEKEGIEMWMIVAIVAIVVIIITGVVAALSKG